MKKTLLLVGLLALAGCVTQSPSKPGTYTADTNQIAQIAAVVAGINAASAPVNPYSAPIGTAIPLAASLAGMASGLWALWKTRKAGK